jgi:hypothetical protein
MKPNVIALVLCLLLQLPTPAEGIILDPRGWNYEPLEFYELVVTGTIVNVRSDRVSLSDLWMDPPETAIHTKDRYSRVKYVTLDVRDVLRGPALSEVTIMVAMFTEQYDTEYREGETVLLCANYHLVLETYYLQSSYGKYVYRDGQWVCEIPFGGSLSLTNEVVREMIDDMSITNVAAEAELVVVGEVTSIETEEIRAADGSPATVTILKLRIQEVRKGTYEPGEVTIRMISAGLYWPAWRRHVPYRYQLEVGQQWYAYLKRDESGWYPFAGSNGMFLVRNEQLYYDARVPLWHSKQVVDRLTPRKGRE